ncbi:MAG TPA: adenosine deaminase, partial [Thiomicrospira sp.]|nr:adenosine deaminase [Thiomicrospira sp.]
MKSFIEKMPKAELHLHIEGTLEPDMMLALAKKNEVSLSYKNNDEVKSAYQFKDLQSFLDLYYQGMQVLQSQEDFYQLTWAYLERCAQQNIIYCEIFFDPQAHMARGILFETVLDGIEQATLQAKEQLGVEAKIIFSILRHLTESEAEALLDIAIQHKSRLIGMGLDSTEKGNPPEKFKNVFKRAGEAGFYRVAHAGEEGDASYVSGALTLLGVDRIDHGNNAMQDSALLHELKDREVALTLCPLSNFRLQVVSDHKSHPLKQMFDMGLKVTINSD